ncbi:succinylglutamate-semialdehyde dehydrogenase [Legionella spiritensis]|uniref:N-succinylglutamate 5-semialdehyde dehydrogenase n=1 Tax=Legionella spiritensis TaxID=452 RepID=A0A0W0Z6K1_LEGSP|nr:succinylglutamate-semialdehyde dehydrogenase [Legionella spiritensis]KTD64772.1 succinylglutamic-5-semialdehyde dehydrogenase [Legionella spiritensis]SNV39760.1 succinylglutamic-5-semialdehyde dehydrogenase [Legionella spiritensis]
MTMNPNTPESGQHYINGSWTNGSGDVFYSYNPVNNQPIWQGTRAEEAEIGKACEAAQSAFKKWRLLPVSERAHYLHQFARQVERQRHELAALISLENGKPYWESETEVNAVIGKVNLSIQAFEERTSEKCSTMADSQSCLRYKPHGVTAVFGPFNFPAHLSNGHIVPALLAGNTVILKPSELTPAVAEMIMRCWHDAGLPPGVINCLQGNAATGQRLLAADIQGVYFTGSYQTGKKIHRLFSDRPEVILALEMGGNNPLVIDEVKDLDAAVYQTLLSAFITAGQRCTCARRVMIPDNSKGEQFLEKLLAACRKMAIGAFDSNPEPFMGPVISFDHALAHLKAQEQLLESGGNALLPMSLMEKNSGLLTPGVIDMTSVAHPADEEIFAPLIQLYRYQDFEEALMLANRTRYGLSAGLLSDNAHHYRQFYQEIRAGLVNWNKPTTGAASNLPFGGIGCSGNHRPSAYFAADYCSYPIASQEQAQLSRPDNMLPGIVMEN